MNNTQSPTLFFWIWLQITFHVIQDSWQAGVEDQVVNPGHDLVDKDEHCDSFSFN
jgi:hypothetical protein